MANYTQSPGMPYQPSQNILQQILSMRKQQGAQSMADVGMPSSGSQPLPSPSGNPDVSLGQLHSISRLAGYDPKTMFGYDMGNMMPNPTASVPSVGDLTEGAAQDFGPAVSSMAPTMGSALSSLFGSGTGASAAGGAASAAAPSLWSALWAAL